MWYGVSIPYFVWIGRILWPIVLQLPNFSLPLISSKSLQQLLTGCLFFTMWYRDIYPLSLSYIECLWQKTLFVLYVLQWMTFSTYFLNALNINNPGKPFWKHCNSPKHRTLFISFIQRLSTATFFNFKQSIFSLSRQSINQNSTSKENLANCLLFHLYKK